jgi:hypothetical protein
MQSDQMKKLQFPIGTWKAPLAYNKEDFASWIADIALFPQQLSELVHGLNEAQLETPYRPQGWTIRQVVHHCADSHMNSFIRFKLALTEERPVTKPYFEDRWAELPDYSLPIQVSIDLIRSLHQRWVFLLESITDEQWNRVYIHPEHGRHFSLKETLSMYSWHCRHHLGHVRGAVSLIKGDI